MYPALTTTTTSWPGLEPIPFLILQTPQACAPAERPAIETHNLARPAGSHSQTTFFSLPFEIRWQIYKLLLPISKHVQSCNHPIRPSTHHQPKRCRLGLPPLTQLQTLLLVCRRMNHYEPIKQIFYREHTFVVQQFAPEPLSDPFAQMVRSNNETHFLDKFSWTDTMPLMRRMVFKLAPPATSDDDLHSLPVRPRDRYSLRSYPVRPSPRQQRGLPDKITSLEFEHHEGWRHTLENLTVLGLHIHNAPGGEMFGFEEWLFKTLWSLVGALPGIQRTRNPDGTERYDSTPEFLEQLRSGSSLVALPAGPMIVVYVVKGREFGAEKRFKEARRIVETVIPTGRFKYVDAVEVMETPFLERKRITPAWVSNEENNLNTELYKDALDKYLDHRDLTLL